MTVQGRGSWSVPNLWYSHSEKGGGLELFLLLGNIAKVSLSLSATAGTCKMCSTSKVKNVFYEDSIDFLVTISCLPFLARASDGTAKLAGELHKYTGPKHLFPQLKWKRDTESCARSRYTALSYPVLMPATAEWMWGPNKQERLLRFSSADVSTAVAAWILIWVAEVRYAFLRTTCGNNSHFIPSITKGQEHCAL